jgi:UDP-glucose 4-epimerase
MTAEGRHPPGSPSAARNLPFGARAAEPATGIPPPDRDPAAAGGLLPEGRRPVLHPAHDRPAHNHQEGWMPNYLVTGGCGFIGSHLVDALVAAGDQALVLDNLSTGCRENLPPAARLTVGDVADAALVAGLMRKVDGCFHLAAVASVQRSNEAWLATHRSNLSGTVCVLDAARQRRVPVVYASSAAVYGEQGPWPIRENDSPRPTTAYGADKLGSEHHARVAGLIHGVPTIGFRFFNVYGPRQDPASPYSGVISIFIDRALRGDPIDLHGGGGQVRDFIYVLDIVRFLVAGMAQASREPRVFNACTGKATSIRALAETISLLLHDAPARLRMAPARAGDIRTSVGSPELAALELGVQAQVSLSDGLRETIQANAARRIAA